MILLSHCIIIIKIATIDTCLMVSINGPPARIDTGIAHVAIILNGRHGRGVVVAGRCLLMQSCRECNTMENDGTYSYVY